MSNRFFLVGSSFEGRSEKKFLDSCRAENSNTASSSARWITRRLACCTRKISANSWPASAVTRPRIVCLSSSIKFTPPMGHEEIVRGARISGFNPRILRNIAAIGNDGAVFNYMQNQTAGVCRARRLPPSATAQNGLPCSVVAPSCSLRKWKSAARGANRSTCLCFPEPPRSAKGRCNLFRARTHHKGGTLSPIGLPSFWPFRGFSMDFNRRSFLQLWVDCWRFTSSSGTVRRGLGSPDALVSADSNSGPVKIIQFDDTGKKLGWSLSENREDRRRMAQAARFPSSIRSPGTPPRNAHSRMPTSENHAKGLYRCILATTLCIPPTPNSNPAPAGPALGAYRQRKYFCLRGQQPRHVPRRSLCRLCDAHLGHVFDRRPSPRLRYCTELRFSPVCAGQESLNVERG